MTKKKRRNLPPTEEELIIFKVWSDMGLTANAIAVKDGQRPKDRPKVFALAKLL